MKRKTNILILGAGILGVLGFLLSCGTGLVENSFVSVVTRFVPASGDIQVDLNKNIVLTVSSALDPASINASTVTVTNSGVTIAGTYSYDATAGTITFTPTSAYPEGAVIKVTLTSDVHLATGESVTAESITFTTLSYASVLAQWKLDGNGLDSSGNGNDLIETSMTYDTTAHYQGTAAAIFDGSTSYMNTAGNVDLGTQFTVTAWIKLPSTVQVSCNGIMTNTTGGVDTDGFKLFVNTFGTSDLTINSEAGDGTNGALLSTSTGFATVNAWKHLAFVVDKAQAAGQRALFYFNGASATQTVAATAGSATDFPAVFNSNAPIYLGTFVGHALSYQGELDDVRIYSTALSAADILRISQQN